MIAETDMPLARRLVPLILALIVALIVVELIRRRKLREEYAILWVGTSVVIWLFAIFPEQILGWLQEVLKVNFLTIVVLAFFVFLALNALHQAVAMSRQTENIRQIAERLALLEEQARGHSKKGCKDAEPPDCGGEEKATS